MKSIIQEASSIAKAVEEGWIKAQKPQQFSVKVLEEAEKNFLGLTKKSAKVAIFFDEPQLKSPTEKSHTIKSAPVAQKVIRPVQQHASQHNPKQHATKQEDRPAHQEKVRTAPQPEQLQAAGQQPHKKKFEPLWNQAIVDRAKEWMNEALKNSKNDHISFTIEPQKFHLRITLSKALIEDPDKEKQLLASFSALILETLKRTFKMSLRGHKIVLTHQPK